MDTPNIDNLKEALTYIQALKKENAEQKSEISELKNKVQKHEQYISNLTEMLGNDRKKMFGRSSEQMKYIEGAEQISLFNEAEKEAAAGTDSVKLSWTAVPGASKNAVSKLVNGELILLNGSLTGTLYTDTDLIPQNTYTYLKQAFNGSMWSTNSLDYCVRVIAG